MNRAFMFGFVDELEKRAFFGTKETNDLQRKLKEVQKGLGKQRQVEVLPAESSRIEETAVRPGSAMASAKNMAGDIARNVKELTRSGLGRKR